ncbi:hypothetical protein RU639_002360 [Aspergillus parasiticus]
MPFQDVALRHVEISSRFWSSVQHRTRETTIPAILRAQKDTGHWYCFTLKEGHSEVPHRFWDSDVYKVIEAACYFMMKSHNDTIMAQVEEAVDMIRTAQHPDGYINSHYTVLGLENRWTNLRDAHELYCLGHLLEATVAYEMLTMSGRLLEPAMKAVRHVDSIFGAELGKKRGYPGHEEIEIGLLRLHELTGDALCLKMATYFIHERGQRDGNDEIYFDHEAKARGGDPYDSKGPERKLWYSKARDYGYHQADCPLTEASEVKGHAVRAMYFYTAATDLVRLTGNKKIEAAISRLWRDMVDHKLYITGGLGAVPRWEGFGRAYLLGDSESDDACYAETCASFALINWCQRLLRLRLHSEYADVMEITLYNGFLGAVNLKGDSFYYGNPLRTYAGRGKERNKWFGVACCPPNVAKLLGSLGSLIYSYKDGLAVIHLYIESEFKVPGTEVVISQQSNMPWSGDVTIKIRGTTALALRIPDWADGYTCSLPGDVVHGYLYIPESRDRTIHLTLPLKARKVYAHPKTGKDEICLMRGPLVYCFEDVDNKDIDIDHTALLDTDVQECDPISVGSLDDVVPIAAAGKQLIIRNWSSLYGSEPWTYESGERKVVAVPFFLRANRGGKGAMRVWTKRLDASLAN